MALIPVVLVDDDADLAEALGEALLLEGFALHSVTTFEEAITRVRELAPPIVLVDYQMPGIDATELIAALRRICRAPIVLCTGMGDAAALAVETGADDVLPKPFRVEQLVRLARATQPAATP